MEKWRNHLETELLFTAINAYPSFQFDVRLLTLWDAAMENGLFRYDLSETKTRIVPGKLQYVTEVCCPQKVEEENSIKIMVHEDCHRSTSFWMFVSFFSIWFQGLL